MNCFCVNNIPYSECCEQIHKDIHQAITAKQLMRSRYSAFVLANGNYLIQSHHNKRKKSIVT